MEPESNSCVYGVSQQSLLVAQCRHGREHLCLPRFRRLLTMSKGPIFAEAMTAKIAKGLGMDTDLQNLVVDGAGGVGKAMNGLYMPVGKYKGKPLYKSSSGHDIFYSGRWKIGRVDDGHPIWVYAAEDASGATPPLGAWTTWGYGRGDANPPPRLELGPPPDGVPLKALFAWLFAVQPPGALGEDPDQTAADILLRVAERPEHNVLDEIVGLLSNMAGDDVGRALSPAHPGFYTAEASCEATFPAARLISVEGLGEWVSSCGQHHGDFRIRLTTDLPEVTVHMKMEVGSSTGSAPVPLATYSVAYGRGGADAVVYFTCAKNDDFANAVHFEVVLHAAGSMEGCYRSEDQMYGSIVGRTSCEYRPHLTDVAQFKAKNRVSTWSAAFVELSPEKVLDGRRAGLTSALEWCVPQAVADGKVLLVAVGGAVPAARASLVSRLLMELGDRETRGRWVSQGGHAMEHLPVEMQGMPLPPSSVLWNEFLREIDLAIAEMARWAGKRRVAVVIVEGALVYWLPAVAAAFKLRFFLRASRSEVWRNLSAPPSAAKAPPVGQGPNDVADAGARQAQADELAALFEHILWPSHLAFGQPCGETQVLKVRDGRQPMGGVAHDLQEQAVAVLNEQLTSAIEALSGSRSGRQPRFSAA